MQVLPHSAWIPLSFDPLLREYTNRFVVQDILAEVGHLSVLFLHGATDRCVLSCIFRSFFFSFSGCFQVLKLVDLRQAGAKADPDCRQFCIKSHGFLH